MELANTELDTVLRLVRNAARRRLLLHLLASNPQDATALPAEMAEDTDTETRLQTRLYHTHLPMLEDARVIEWDRDTDAVTRGPAFGEVRPLLKLMDENRNTLPDHWL